MLRQHARSAVSSLFAVLAGASVHAQQATSSAPAAANSTLSSSLGLFVFPAKNQSSEKQAGDEWACFGWAKSQTGIDPLNVKPQAAATPAGAPAQSSSSSSAGTVAKGTVGGAVAGTAIGAIAGNTGKGAAIGAAAGLLGGAAVAKRNSDQAKTQQQLAQQQASDASQQQAEASVAQQKATYNKAFSACMEGKGYTVK
jgi:Glycine zipper